MICHIHLYFPFTMGHLNHIRIYYHHADSAPADNTNHDKMERWLYKHPRLYITSYELGWIAAPTCHPDVIVYLYGWTKGVDIITSLSISNLCLLLSQTMDINSVCVCVCVRAFICGSIHHSAVGVPTQLLVRRDLCCNASNQQTFTVKYDFINRPDQ